MIILKNICKEFNGVKVLNNVNLTFKKGTITAILGGSGIGKTTLLNILANLIDYDGEIVGVNSVAYAFQNPTLIPNLTVKENILIASKVNEGELDYALKEVDIFSLKDKKAKNLSVGEKQRVNFLRALLNKSELLLIDETFSSLDIKSKLKCEKLLKEYVNKGNLTVILVTHDIGLALSIADEITVITKEKTESILNDKNEKNLKDKLFNLFEV